MPAVREGAIPSRDEHRRRTRRIWVLCGLAALFILVSMGGTIALLVAAGRDVHRIVAATTVIFQVVIAMFAVGFTTPLFLEQRANLALSLDMGRESLHLGTEAAGAMTGVRNELVPVIRELRTLVEQAGPVVAVANRQAQDGYLEKIEAHMRAIKEAVERGSGPVKPKTRTVDA